MTDQTDRTDQNPTRGEQMVTEVVSLIKSRHALLWVVSREELRVERAFFDVAAAIGKVDVRCWDCSSALTDAKGNPMSVDMSTGKATSEKSPNDRTIPLRDPGVVLDAIAKVKDRCIYILRDMHKWLDPMTTRSLRNLARALQSVPKEEQRSVVILAPSSEIPPELAGQVTIIEWPLPDRREIGRVLDDVLTRVPQEVRDSVVNGVREAAIDAAVGLGSEEASNCFAKSLVTLRTISPGSVAKEKKRVIEREKVLGWIDPDPRGFDAVGGLSVLKTWLQQRRCAFSAKARTYGLRPPKGMLLLGPPGTGKSLVAKCVAAAWEMPLLRLDMGALKSKWVGESEANIRRALQVAETVSPCTLWLDEIEKALSGSTGPQGDGGVAADALGAILSWMQERQGSVFVVATANDVSALPPELLRKGRFDEIFFVDLPSRSERTAVLAVALQEYGRTIDPIDLDAVAEATEGFVGAEIAALVPDAMFAAFADGERQVTAADLLTAAQSVVPLSKTASEKIEKLRTWAKGRARLASAPETTAQGGEARSGRVLDI